MQEVGEILHIANSGRAIVKLSKTIKEGQILCDDKGHKVVKVTELIGPVKEPYASSIPLTNNISKYTGRTVFALETTPPKRKSRRRRK